MSDQFNRNRKLSDAYNYYDAKHNSNYQNHSNRNGLNQLESDYKTSSYLNNRQDIYLEQSIPNNTYTQNGNYYDEFNNRNSQNYSENYPYVLYDNLVDTLIDHTFNLNEITV